MTLLVADTRALIELERAGAPCAACATAHGLRIADILHDVEAQSCRALGRLGLDITVHATTSLEWSAATHMCRANDRLSISDALALALAQIHDWILLSGDVVFERHARAQELPCRNVRWLYDAMSDGGGRDA